MKVFLTVGTQLTFDRLVKAVDQWAGENSDIEVFAQIGPSNYVPNNMRSAQFVDAVEFRRQVEEADAIVAHAGMGSIISALELGKPVIVMPRRADLNEHRNEHQLATARRLLAQGRVIVAFDETHLREKLARIRRLSADETIEKYASPRLISVVQEFILNGTYHSSRPVEVEVGFGDSSSEGVRSAPLTLRAQAVTQDA